MTCVAFAHMVHATQHVGWDVMTCGALEHMVDAMQHAGWGGVGCDDMCCT